MVPEPFADVAPWPDWCAAAQGALKFLAEHVGWDVWMVTEVVEERQVVLLAHPTAAVPAYASQTTGALRDVAAYVGIPLVRADGTLFGTLCGVAFRAKPLSAAREISVVEAAARMLSTLMAAGMQPPQLPQDARA